MMEGWKVGRGGGTGAVLLGAALLSILPTFQPSASAQDTLPIGYGTLKRDDIVVRFATEQIAIQVLPLAQGVIRLLAPDTYASLRQLLQARFSPDDLNITSLGRLYRPVGIVPLSPRWSSYQLDAREQAVAIYLFEEGISFRDALSVIYQDATNDSWTSVLHVLDRERSQVLARAKLNGKSD